MFRPLTGVPGRYAEVGDWDFAAAARKAGAGGATGHFTQVVWKATAQVRGCGLGWAETKAHGWAAWLGVQVGMQMHRLQLHGPWVRERVARNAAAFARTRQPLPPPTPHPTGYPSPTPVQVGCGVAACTTNSPFGSGFPSWTLVVCQYRWVVRAAADVVQQGSLFLACAGPRSPPAPARATPSRDTAAALLPLPPCHPRAARPATSLGSTPPT